MTNLASGLCGKAQGGQILISHGTKVMVEKDFKTNALGDIDIAGFSSAVPIYEVLGPLHKIRLDEAFGRFTKSWKKKKY